MPNYVDDEKELPNLMTPTPPPLSSRLPLWYQLCQTLRAKIISGELKPGDRIDPEVRLAQKHGMSVIPVRQALRALESDGLIVRHRGSGTFVSDAASPLLRTTTSLETLYSRKFTTPSRILDHGETPPPPQIAAWFGDGAKLAFVRRLAYRDNAPWSYGTLYFPAHYAEKITPARLKRYPLYRLMRDLYGLELARSHFEAKAIAADAETAAFLQIEPFSPVLSLKSVTYDRADTVVGAFDMVFRGDPFVFSFDTPHDLPLGTNAP